MTGVQTCALPICFPVTIKGVDVSIALTGSIPVFGNGKTLSITNGTTTGGFYTGAGSVKIPATGFYNVSLGAAVASGSQITPDYVGLGLPTKASGLESGLIADLGSASAISINALRTAFAIQKLYEKDARGGTRYIEIIKAHFGVTSPDSRMQRPEYLGGNRLPININQVVQMSSNAGSDLLGDTFAIVTGKQIGRAHV